MSKNKFSQNPGPIGIFDSGYGGLTILRQIRSLMPQYDYLYLGDNARAPYGTRSFDIVYPRSKISQILQFIDIENQNAFTLQEFNDKMNACKIILNEMNTSDIADLFKKLKDIIYAAGGKQFLFKDKNSISKNDFIKLFLGQTNFSEESLNAIYYFLIKSDRNFTLQDYKKYFEDDQRIMNEEFDLKVINNFKYAIQHSNMKIDEYFSHLLTYNVSRDSNVITRYDFHKIFLAEKYFNYSAEEIDHIFDMIDLKKDNYIDRDEFNIVINKTSIKEIGQQAPNCNI